MSKYENMKHYLSKLEYVTRLEWDKLALCDYNGEQFTYAQAARLMEELRIFFLDAGLKKGDKVAICARNSARWAISFLAANVSEMVVVPILADFTPESVINLLNHCEAKILFTDAEIWAKLNPKDLSSLKVALNVKDYKALYASDKDLQEKADGMHKTFLDKWSKGFNAANVAYPVNNADDLAIINYTSGTTSDPKGVMLTYGAMTDTVEFSQNNVKNTSEDKVVSMLPLAHMYGLAIEFIYPHCSGCQVYFLGKTPSPSSLIAAMQEVRPYMVVTVPLVMEKIYDKSLKPALSKGVVKILTAIPGINNLIYRKAGKKLQETFGGQVRIFIMGGAALRGDVEKCFKKMKFPYTVGYGMTEACPLLGWETWQKFAPRSCGKPVHDLRIDSEDPERIAGEIQVRGANLTIGYYKNEEATRLAFTDDGWFRTGDLAVLDSQRNIFIRGRAKSMILSSSGQNIYPEEVEAVVNSQPNVVESVVVDRGSHLVALVLMDPEYMSSLDPEVVSDIPEKIRIMANEKLPVYSKLTKVELRTEPFEKTPKMSIRRFLYK